MSNIKLFIVIVVIHVVSLNASLGDRPLQHDVRLHFSNSSISLQPGGLFSFQAQLAVSTATAQTHYPQSNKWENLFFPTMPNVV